MCSWIGFAVYNNILWLLFRSTSLSLGVFSAKMEDRRLKSCWNRCGASSAFPIVNTLWEDCWGNGESYTQVGTTDGLYYYGKVTVHCFWENNIQCYGLLKVIFLNHMSFGGCRSAGCKKSNDTMRLIITTFVGIVFGFFIGVSFPTLSLVKVSRMFFWFNSSFFVFLPYILSHSYVNLWVASLQNW